MAKAKKSEKIEKPEATVADLKSLLAGLKLDVAVGKEKNSSKIRQTRKQIARLLTKQNER